MMNGLVEFLCGHAHPGGSYSPSRASSQPLSATPDIAYRQGRDLDKPIRAQLFLNQQNSLRAHKRRQGTDQLLQLRCTGCRPPFPAGSSGSSWRDWDGFPGGDGLALTPRAAPSKSRQLRRSFSSSVVAAYKHWPNPCEHENSESSGWALTH